MKLSKFNLSHDNSLTLDMGQLVPFCLIDCLPNDRFRISMDSFIRAQPMMAPLMHKVSLQTTYWFVPYRILWNEWEDFITAGISGSEVPTFPTIDIEPTTSSLSDYFGLPVNGASLNVSALPFRAYVEIYNTRFRDEDIQDELAISYDSGSDTTTSTALKNVDWKKDYFTTARASTQRGSEVSVPISAVTSGTANTITMYAGVNLTLTSDASINFTVNDTWQAKNASLNSINILSFDPSTGVVRVSFEWTWTYRTNGISDDMLIDNYVSSDTANITLTAGSFTSDSLANQSTQFTAVSGAGSISINSTPSGTSGDTVLTLVLSAGEYNRVPAGTVTVSELGSMDIRDLRLSSALQRYNERSLKYGNRYEEYIASAFGTNIRDSRIQRPEYLGGSGSVLQISEVLQTAEGTNTGVGTMRGHGVAGLSQRPIRFKCPEHGLIIGLMSIRPKAVYMQGLNKMWRKFSRFDYFTKELAGIGMSEIYQSELYATGDNYDTVFGYQDKYQEYRSQPNMVTGEFRDLLDYWNLARQFDSAPVLNSDFLTMNPSKRIFAEQTQNEFLAMLRNNIRAYRIVPKRAVNILK